MTAKPLSNSYPTLAAIAALAFIVACVAHEAVGHGGTCVVMGRHITLLTSVYFHCSNGGGIIDAAGPLMNLIVGGVCWAALYAWSAPSTNCRLFLVLTMAFNLFWGAGYFVFSAVTDSGDLAFVLRDLALQPAWLWRCGMGALGVYLYARSIALVGVHLPPGIPLLMPYLIAGTVSCIAAGFFNGPTLPALAEAAQESFGAGVGLLILAYRRARETQTPSVVFVPHSNGWLVASLIVTLGFFATLGRGLVFGHHG